MASLIHVVKRGGKAEDEFIVLTSDELAEARAAEYREPGYEVTVHRTDRIFDDWPSSLPTDRELAAV